MIFTKICIYKIFMISILQLQVVRLGQVVQKVQDVRHLVNNYGFSLLFDSRTRFKRYDRTISHSAHPGAIPLSDKDYVYSSLPPLPDGMLIHRRVTLSIKFAGVPIWRD